MQFLWVGYNALDDLLKVAWESTYVYVSVNRRSRVDRYGVEQAEHYATIQARHDTRRDEIHYWRACFGRDTLMQGDALDAGRSAKIARIEAGFREILPEILERRDRYPIRGMIAFPETTLIDGSLDGFDIDAEGNLRSTL